MISPTPLAQDKGDVQEASSLKEVADKAAEAQRAEARALIDAIQEGVAKEPEEDLSWLRESALGGPEAARAQEEAEDAINQMAKNHLGEEDDYLARARAAIEQGRGGRSLDSDEDPLYALITMGLGKTAIYNLLTEASEMEVPVVFVVRGFDPDQGGIQALVEDVLDINEFEVEFEMHVNPTMFRQTDSERVPVFVQKNEDGAVKIRRGAVNLHAALESMTDEQLDLTIGETFEIAEPDLLDVIDERIAEVDGEKIMADAVERVSERLLRSRQSLPVATEATSYLVDPAVQLRSDITAPDGRVIAPAGTTINPLEMAPWTRQYIIFDATSPWQVEQARRWASEAPVATTFIGTRLPEDEKERKALGKKLGDHVHLLDDLIVRRMDLRAIPSRARQDGLMVRIDTAIQEKDST